MQYVFPDYYKNFKCTAGTCRHNCCIGWEIDIDPETLAYYQTVTGEMGQRLRSHISHGDTPHFILGEHQRCPFLNRDNLCDIILTLGEEHICGICTDHPRFRNELPGRVETGIGLCCEEAARLILGNPAPMRLEVCGTAETKDEIVALRDQIITLLQDRSRDIPSRVQQMLTLCGASLPEWTMGQWAELFLPLERLDEAWTQVLHLLKTDWSKTDLPGFDAYMSARQTEYEQLLVYLVYRHLANAFDEAETAARAAFAALGYILLHHIGAVIWNQSGVFTFEQQVELARLFSSEIEYSDENLYIILESLY